VGKPNRANAHGYTLIEVLTVIMVLAIIIGSGWALSTGYVTYLQKARDTERQSDVEGYRASKRRGRPSAVFRAVLPGKRISQWPHLPYNHPS